jgi:polyphosphate kinase
MIGRVLTSPLIKVLLYYALLAAGVVLLAQLFPVLESAFSLERFRSLIGLGDFEAVLPEGATTSESGGGFLGQPNPGLRTLIAVVGALILVIPIAWVYMVTKREVRYDQSLVHTIIMLPIAVTGIVIIVQDSIALAFSLAGIVAAVRFRHTLQDTKDAVYIFLAIAVGLAAGVQALTVALVVSALFNVVVLALWRFDVGNIYAQESLPREGRRPTPPSLPSRRAGSDVLQISGLLAEQAGAAAEQPADAMRPVINPELSLLEFHSRVLALAEDATTPLIARLRFLSIFSSNIDEYVSIKVGGLKQAVAEGITRRSIDGRMPRELLHAIAIRLRALMRRQYRCFNELRERSLPQHGIRIRSWDGLSKEELAYLKGYFDERVFPMLTPKAITQTPGHPFPYIEELMLSLAVVVRDPRTSRDHFVLLDIADAMSRFVQLPESSDFVAIEDLIRAHIDALYPARQVLEVHTFRITRSAEVEFGDATADTFLEVVEDEVQRRPQGAVVRIEVERSMPYAIRDLLLRELRREEAGKGVTIEASDIYETDGVVDLGSVVELTDLPMPELDYPPFEPAIPIEPDRSVFEVLDQRDVLVYHPYDSFEASVQRLIVDAASDPDVASIKLTLYRPGGPSEIADALLQAAAGGKDVTVFVEVKARFDEALNIYWAKQLERGGIHIVTGMVKHKTHSKVALVVRRVGDELKRYAHVGTGNYNPETACQYTDLGLLTSDEAICSDLSVLFNELTGSSTPPAGRYQRILVSPTFMLRRFLELIEREAEHARAGRPAHIRAKVNGLADAEIIEALYHAGKAGARVDLIVRSICALRPGMPDVSENIRVVSAVGRFLEHARIFAFANGGEPEFYIGSADWRPRNLRRRVEVTAPVLDPVACERLDRILETELRDPTAWHLQTDGQYLRGSAHQGARSAQDQLLERATEA